LLVTVSTKFCDGKDPDVDLRLRVFTVPFDALVYDAGAAANKEGNWKNCQNVYNTTTPDVLPEGFTCTEYIGDTEQDCISDDWGDDVYYKSLTVSEGGPTKIGCSFFKTADCDVDEDWTVKRTDLNRLVPGMVPGNCASNWNYMSNKGKYIHSFACVRSCIINCSTCLVADSCLTQTNYGIQ